MFPVKDHAEERGFAVAVPPHEPHTLARVYGKADAVEERLLSVRFFYVRDLKHGSSLYRRTVNWCNKKA
jgi:hypothetical protein